MKITRKQLRNLILEAVVDPKKYLGHAATRLMMDKTRPETMGKIIDRLGQDYGHEIKDQLYNLYDSEDEESRRSAEELASSLGGSPFDYLYDYDREEHLRMKGYRDKFPWNDKNEDSFNLLNKLFGRIPYQREEFSHSLTWVNYSTQEARTLGYKLRDRGKTPQGGREKSYLRAFDKIMNVYDNHFTSEGKPIQVEYYHGDRGNPTNKLYDKGYITDGDVKIPTLAVYDIVNKFDYVGIHYPKYIGGPDPQTLVFYRFK